MAPRFAHPIEAAYAKLLDEHGIPWEYEPHTFRLAVRADGTIAEAMTPDFYLPTIGMYVECTTTRPRLMNRKRRKARKLGERYGAIVTLLGREDLETLLNGRAPSPSQPVRCAARRTA
jgi:hypoxanthine phosphoribosyltransferase